MVMSAFFIFQVVVGVSPAMASPDCDFPVIFNFGDSNSDTGAISAAFEPIRWPYGDVFFNKPSGRDSDGRLIIDFIGKWRNISVISLSFRPGLLIVDLGFLMLLQPRGWNCRIWVLIWIRSALISGTAPISPPADRLYGNRMKPFMNMGLAHFSLICRLPNSNSSKLAPMISTIKVSKTHKFNLYFIFYVI